MGAEFFLFSPTFYLSIGVSEQQKTAHDELVYYIMIEIYELPYMKILPRINEHTNLYQAGTGTSVMWVVPGGRGVKKLGYLRLFKICKGLTMKKFASTMETSWLWTWTVAGGGGI